MLLFLLNNDFFFYKVSCFSKPAKRNQIIFLSDLILFRPLRAIIKPLSFVGHYFL